MPRPWLLLRSVGSLSRSPTWLMLCCGAVLLTAVPVHSQDVKKAPVGVIGVDEINPKGYPQSLQKPADNPTVYLWQEGDDTWRVRVRTQKHKRVFTGKIKVNGGKVVKIFDFWGLEAGVTRKSKATEDFGRWNAAHDEIEFKFHTHAGEDGFAFKIDPNVETITFDLKTDDESKPKLIRIGPKEANPTAVPFTLTQVKPKPPEKPTEPTKDK